MGEETSQPYDYVSAALSAGAGVWGEVSTTLPQRLSEVCWSGQGVDLEQSWEGDGREAQTADEWKVFRGLRPPSSECCEQGARLSVAGRLSALQRWGRRERLSAQRPPRSSEGHCFAQYTFAAFRSFALSPYPGCEAGRLCGAGLGKPQARFGLEPES